jgi:serine/threonine protein kinase
MVTGFSAPNLPSPSPSPANCANRTITDLAPHSAQASAPRAGARWPHFEAPAKYQLLRVIGSGSAGTVFLARDLRLGRLVALKVLGEPRDPQALERFHCEARLLARLAHPAIVAVHELDTSAGRTYLALDYVDGGNLARARLEPRALAATLRGVVDALAHAHDLGIVHGDVKPENVLLDRHGRARLCDFGVATMRSSLHGAAYDTPHDPAHDPAHGAAYGAAYDVARGTATGAGRVAARAETFGGTPLAMSPEQARGEVLGPASDQFSLGVTLHRQLTGSWPFRGRTLGDVLCAIQRDDPPRLRALDPRVPAALERIVLRCLEKDPALRFPSMRALGRELDRFLGPRPLPARLLPALLRSIRRAPPACRPRIHSEELP